MGITSQQRVSNIKQMRRAGANRPHATTTRQQEAIAAIADDTQPASLETPAEVNQCRACLDKTYKKGHIISCSKSVYFNKTDDEIRQMKQPKIVMGIKTKQGMLKMFGGWRSGQSLEVKADFNMSADALCQLVDKTDASQGMSTKAPPAIEILARAFQKRFPLLNKATNIPLATVENTKKLQWFKSSFAGGLAATSRSVPVSQCHVCCSQWMSHIFSSLGPFDTRFEVLLLQDGRPGQEAIQLDEEFDYTSNFWPSSEGRLDSRHDVQMH